MADRWTDAEQKVLTENTAQTILKHLRRLEQKRGSLGARWIWELLQNARDAATAGRVNVTVRLKADQLTFEHDGRPFRHEELAHLIYHGTTKLDENENIGHFGSGFLSTHLVSRKVRVRGPVDGGDYCDFWLDRTSEDQHKLADAMSRAMKNCRESCQSTSGKQHDVRTSFTYPLDHHGSSLVDSALKDLRELGPLVLAFAIEIASITVDTPSDRWCLMPGEPKPLDAGLELANIIEESSDSKRLHHVVIAPPGESVQVVLPLKAGNGGFSVGLDANTPRIFIMFPIYGTTGLAIPAVLQSKRFEPTEDRDGIWLDSGTARGDQNRKIVEDAIPAIKLIIQAAATHQWSNTDRLLAFDVSNLPDWVDKSWLRQLLVGLLEDVESTPLVPTVGGTWTAIKHAWFPLADDETHVMSLWALARKLSDSKTTLPPEDVADRWSRNLRNWAVLRDRPVAGDQAAFTISRVARMVSDAQTTNNLASRLDNPGDVLNWLAQLFELIHETNQTSLYDQWRLLPSQTGQLRKRNELFRDSGIAVELKNVARLLNIDICGMLLDSNVEISGLKSLLAEKKEEEVVDELLNALEKACSGDGMPITLVPASVGLFWWLASRDAYLARLDRFPVVTAEVENDSRVFVERLLLQRDQRDNRLLAPIETWPENAKPFAALFPKRRVFNTEYSRHTKADWERLSNCGVVYREPLCVVNIRLDKRHLENLVLAPLADGVEHRSSCDLNMTTIACMEARDIGLIDLARKSRSHAVRLIEFLLEYVLQADAKAFERVMVPCECKQEHEAYQAAWLAPLRERKWIPPQADGQGAQNVTAESLSTLLSMNRAALKRFDTDAGRSFLQALGISPADFALRSAAPDEKTRMELVGSLHGLMEVVGGCQAVRQLVDDIKDDSEFLEAIRDRKALREKVRLNQRMGRLIEEILRKQLEAEGLTVERTGEGSDFEVECDFVENDQEVIFTIGREGRSTLLEVKSTHGGVIKMTPRQVKTACETQDRFALCVVPVRSDSPTEEEIRETSRFVFGIGASLRESWDAYRTIRDATEEAQQHHGAIVLEITEGQVRFRISRQIWENGLNFNAAVDMIIGSKRL